MNYISGDQKLLNEIQPLWEQLRQIHERDSIYFKEKFNRTTFHERMSEMLHQIGNGEIGIVLAKNQDDIVGYCVSSFADGIGAIESICVDNSCRGQGIGHCLMERSLTWIQARNPRKIVLTVAVGHEEVYPFYEKFGFYPRVAELEMI